MFARGMGSAGRLFVWGCFVCHTPCLSPQGRWGRMSSAFAVAVEIFITLLRLRVDYNFIMFYYFLLNLQIYKIFIIIEKTLNTIFKLPCSLSLSISVFLFMQHDRGRKYEVDVKTREEITSLIAHHVTAVNYIYRNTKFDGRTEHRNIRFEVSLPPHNNLCCLSPAHCNHSIESCPLALCQQCATRTKHAVLLVLFKLKVKLHGRGRVVV